MTWESYCVPFLDFVGNGDDPHECWQEDGFRPDQIDAELEHILVWGTKIGLSYFNNGGMVASLQFISGRTLPEVILGFEVLGCPDSQRVCETILRRFGNRFPRRDAIRSERVAHDRQYFEQVGDELWDAMEVDRYEERAESFYKTVCVANSILPRVYPSN